MHKFKEIDTYVLRCLLHILCHVERACLFYISLNIYLCTLKIGWHRYQLKSMLLGQFKNVKGYILDYPKVMYFLRIWNECNIENDKFMQRRLKSSLKNIFMYFLCNIEMNWDVQQDKIVQEKKTPKTIWSCYLVVVCMMVTPLLK